MFQIIATVYMDVLFSLFLQVRDRQILYYWIQSLLSLYKNTFGLTLVGRCVAIVLYVTGSIFEVFFCLCW